MATSHRVRCFNKTSRYDPHERISHIGGIDNGKGWKLTQSDAIAGIEAGKWLFYVQAGGHTVDVIVATHNGHKYLKTRNNGLHPDNLLSLPECP